MGYGQNLPDCRSLHERQPSGIHREGAIFSGAIFRLPRRRAVSTLIGGAIVLTLLLTALGTMVLVTQQYDQYQQTANTMAQYRNQQRSENLAAISPGLTIVNSTTISGWGSGCGTRPPAVPIEYNCYNATISNLGTVGVQIMRIYINSTGLAGSGCSSPNPQPCILNPTSAIARYAFNQANRFLNPGEVNYQVTLALPTGVALPDPTPAFPRNTIVIVTSRGNVFSFQWPLQASNFGQSQSAYSQGNMKVAYQATSSGGYDSSHDYYGASGHTFPNGPYCHTETLQNYPAGAGYAEKLTFPAGVVTGTTLYFVNPWITSTILENTRTTFYIYVIIINTGQQAYSPTAGTIDITGPGTGNHLSSLSLLGVYYNGAFYASANSPSIAPGAYYYAIYQITPSYVDVGSQPTSSVMWWGGASITNGLNSKAEDQSYFSGTILLSGLWIRYETSSGNGGCA